jgi:hypothetical protein
LSGSAVFLTRIELARIFGGGHTPNALKMRFKALKRDALKLLEAADAGQDPYTTVSLAGLPLNDCMT